MDLRDEGLSEEQVDAIIRDYRQAELEPRVVALLDWCVKLTRTPGAMNETDVETLRNKGWSDEEILNAAAVCAYFNFINRLADGLGVDLEPEMAKLPPLSPCAW